MTSRNFPPADQCEPEDLDAIADLVVSDPSASWGLAGSREHIEALCRRYQALVQDLSVVQDRALQYSDACAEARRAAVALERDLARVANCADEVADEIAYLKVRDAHHEAARTRLGDLAFGLLDDQDALRAEVEWLTTNCAYVAGVKLQVESDLAAARRAIADREDEIARVNNERQAEVNEAAAQRERADEAETSAEIFEMVARAALAKAASKSSGEPLTLAEIVRAVDGRVARALQRVAADNARLTQQLEDTAMLLEGQQQTLHHNDHIQSAFAAAVPAICDGKTIEQVNLELDGELAAHPDVGPLHHARDQRDPDAAWHEAAAQHHRDRHAARRANRDERPIRTTTDAALVPCEHRTDVPCAACEMKRRRQLFNQEDTTP